MNDPAVTKPLQLIDLSIPSTDDLVLEKDSQYDDVLACRSLLHIGKSVEDEIGLTLRISSNLSIITEIEAELKARLLGVRQ